MEDVHINVVEDFCYDSENEQYNRDYLLWRRHSKTQHIYRFTDNAKENVYVAGDAAVPQTAATAERNTLMRCGQLIGAALLLFLIAELLGGSILIWVLQILHIDIRLDFLSLSMEGSQWAVVAVRIVIMLLKYLIPSIVLIRVCRIPRDVCCPLTLHGLPELLASIGAAMLISGIYSLTANSAGVEHAQLLFTYKDTAAIAAYGFFDVLIASLIAELLLRGCIFMILRQFGDPFAIVTTAVIAFLFPNALADRISELLLGLAAGFIMVRAGSLAKCTIMRMIYSCLIYARLVLIYTNRSMQLWEYALLLISMGVLIIALYVRVRRQKLLLSNRKTALSNMNKAMSLTQSVTMLPWTATSLLLTLLQIFY